MDGHSRGSSIPNLVTPLFGRDRDLELATQQLLRADVRLLSFIGAPGAGKTRLAMAVASRVASHFKDGVGLVDLSAVTDPNLVASAIAQHLGLVDNGRTQPEWQLRDYLAGKEMLLVLDNFEQVVEAAPTLSELAIAAPGLKLLVTSRTSLDVSMETAFEVAPLEVPDRRSIDDATSLASVPSVALFLTRARGVRPDLTFSGPDLLAAAEICIRLDGLPLALELAAARCRVLAPQTLLARLEKRLDLLTAGQRDLPLRHQTLRGAIGWSYSLLSSEEQRLFRCLGAFADGCDLEDVEALWETLGRKRPDLLDLVQSLSSCSLITVAPSPQGSTRLRMLETIREYSQECLGASQEAWTVGRQHALHFLGLAEAAAEAMTGSRQAQWLDRLEVEHANLVAALRWVVAHDGEETAAWGARMVDALWRFWWRRGYLTEGRRHVDEVLKLAGLRERTEWRARALLSAGLLALWQAFYQEAREFLDEAVSIARDAGDRGTLAYGLAFQGRIARDLGETEAVDLGAEAVELFRQTDDRWGLGVALHFLGLSLAQHDAELARPYFLESIAIFESLGAPGDVAMPFRGMGLVYYLLEDFEAAQSQFEQSALRFRSAGDDWSSAMVFHDLGSVAEARGSTREATAFLCEGLRIWRRLGNRRGSLICLVGLARVALTLSDFATAARLLSAVEANAGREGIAFEPTDGTSVVDGLGAARSALGEGEFHRVADEGAKLGFDAAVEAGLGVEALVRSRRQAERTTRQTAIEKLSPREREVAGLLPRGLTNRQIAEALTITEGTANLHVKHILSKLGFSARSQIAAWAVEQGLQTQAMPSRGEG